MKKTAEYTIFGKTKQVPIKVYKNNKLTDSDTWDEELWIEVSTDWYALGCSDFMNKKIRIIEREIWLRCKDA